jgi:hypothetical protein
MDPRFPGGTSSAVAQEILTLYRYVDITFCAIETRMFKGQTINPRLQEALDEAGISVQWNPPLIRGAQVAFHNPACLKFNNDFAPKIICDTLSMVTHENFLTPQGLESFDVKACIGMVDQRTLARQKTFAPISPYNARTVRTWLDTNPQRWTPMWTVENGYWFNICSFTHVPPNTAPRDKRGRVSRPGFEKFPSHATMLRHFPEHAESNTILGADSFLLDPASIPPHWSLHPFGSLDVADCLARMDFFVYYTHPNLQESFGRVIAEAIAAGKMVITDPNTAQNFGGAVVADGGDNVDSIIAHFVANPDLYVAFVANAQATLARFSAATFLDQFLTRTPKAPP